jgi:N-acetylglucosaminyl-diphospho-decaprenol L-rhamnosyltransferase
MNSTSRNRRSESDTRARIDLSTRQAQISASCKPLVDIIIVNWNSGSQLNRCLGQIGMAVKEGFQVDRIVVIDNASSDSSVADLTVRNDRLVIVRNRRNAGFAAACNQGANGSRADYLLFMNPDVYLGEDSLSIPIEFFSDPANFNAAICGPRLVDQDGITQKTCSRFPATKDFCAKILGLDRVMPGVFPLPLMKEWSHDHDRIVDQAIGACLFVRRNVFQQLNGFDERFFVYFEEVDLCFRCRKSGRDTYFLSGAKAVHSGGGCSSQALGKRLFYSLQSRILYGLKHFSPVSAAVLCFATIFVEPFSRSALAAAHCSIKELRSTWAGYWLLCCSIPSLLQKAREGAQIPVGSGAQVNPRAADNLSVSGYRNQ